MANYQSYLFFKKHDKNHKYSFKLFSTFVKIVEQMRKYTLYQLILYYGELQFRHALNLAGANANKKYFKRISNLNAIIFDNCEKFKL